MTLRDGLQLTGEDAAHRAQGRVVRDLLALGVPELEIGSLARPDLVPPMADTLDVVAALTPDELDRCWVWVATPRHVEKAAAAGARNFQYCFSASDAHNRANIGRATEASLAAMPAAVEQARAVGGGIQLCLATAFTCPFDGRSTRAAGARDRERPAYRRRRRHRPLRHPRSGGPRPGHSLSPGSGTNPERGIVFHGHDTWGLGVANTSPRWRPARAWSTAPSADSAAALRPGRERQHRHEDLLFATRPDWLTPARSVRGRPGGGLLAELDEPNRSRAAQGARSSATPSSGSSAVADAHVPCHHPIPEPGMASLAAGRVHVPEQPPPRRLRDACASGDFDVVVAQLTDRFDAVLLAAAKSAGISNYAVGYDNIDVRRRDRVRHPRGQHPGVLTDATADWRCC